MSVIIVLIMASLVVGLIFVGAFIWSVQSGQFEDTSTPALRVLGDNDFKRAETTAVASQPGKIVGGENIIKVRHSTKGS